MLSGSRPPVPMQSSSRTTGDDRTPAPVTLVPRLRDRLQDSVELYVDGGVLTGSDVAAAIGLGADAVLVGRADL